MFDGSNFPTKNWVVVIPKRPVAFITAIKFQFLKKKLKSPN